MSAQMLMMYQYSELKHTLIMYIGNQICVYHSQRIIVSLELVASGLLGFMEH